MLSNSIGIFFLVRIDYGSNQWQQIGNEGTTPITFTVIGAIFVIVVVIEDLNVQIRHMTIFSQLFSQTLCPTKSEKTSGWK